MIFFQVGDEVRWSLIALKPCEELTQIQLLSKKKFIEIFSIKSQRSILVYSSIIVFGTATQLQRHTS